MFKQALAFILLAGLLHSCSMTSRQADAWIAVSQSDVELDVAIVQCQQEVTPTMIKVRTDFILQENAQRRDCEKAIRQSPEAKATYVDDGFGGLKSLDDDAIAEMCEPSLGERRRREAEIESLQRAAMEPCMQGLGFDLVLPEN